MAREQLIPAPIDEKNITSDWICEIFDYGDVVEDNGYCLGFSNHVPVICNVHDNIAEFSVIWSVMFTREQCESAWAHINDRLHHSLGDWDSVKVNIDDHDGFLRTRVSFFFKERIEKNLFN